MKEHKNIFISLICVFGFLFLVFGFSQAQATTLYLSPSSGTYNINQTFQVAVLVSSTAQPVNAYSGVISFSQTNIEVVSISTNNSIVDFWIQKPDFSNSAGQVNFEGVTFNPGFHGTGGRIITIIFRAKSAGTATFRFTESAVLAHDGIGTNILDSVLGAQYQINGVISEPPVVCLPAAPVISSLTHPDSEKWYSNNSPSFKWGVPDHVTAVSLLASRIVTAVPIVLHEPAITERHLGNLDEGVWYFSARFRNAAGWGAVGRFKFQIDTEPPEYFTITEIPRKNLAKPIASFKFDAEDETSGISHYEIWINNERQEDWKDDDTGVYTTPILKSGEYELIARAVDFAGNYLEEDVWLEVIPVEPPIIVSYPAELTSGEVLVIRGTAVPLQEIEIRIKRADEEVEIRKTQTDKDGRFEFTYPEFLERGEYKIWAIAINEWGARSEKSEEIEIRIDLPFLSRISKIAIDYMNMIFTLIALIVGVILFIFYCWYRIALWQKRLRVKTETKTISKAFKTLREEIEEQINYLERKPDLTEREREIKDKLKKTLSTSEKAISKDIKDIKDELG